MTVIGTVTRMSNNIMISTDCYAHCAFAILDLRGEKYVRDSKYRI